GGFEQFTRKPLSQAVSRDQTTLLGGQLTPGPPVIMVGSANYEDGRSEGGAVVAYDLVSGEMRDLATATSSSTGPLALADYDGDGQLDLFVGGRVVAGRYPEPASSRLFRNDGGNLVEDSNATALLRRIGLVSGAIWADLDGDGFPELILACEWGPIRIFRNDHGRLVPWNAPVETINHQLSTINQLTGWWNGVAVGDFDGDGRLDLVASNWGQNTKYQPYRQQPLRLFYGDFSDSGGVDLLEAYYEPSMAKLVPWQHLGRVGPAMPFVTARFSTFRQFGQASVEEILGNKERAAQTLEVNWLETTVFLNRQDHYEARPLPMEAQLSPAFGICVADIDNDGHEDLFLSQNFFATEPETDRYDAGRGLWLRGDGNGGFRALPSAESGVRVYGEQRGAAVADFDHDGRIDFCVSQNGAATRLFRNTGARPGMRVRLQGPPGNPTGVGAQVRCSNNNMVKEVHAGSGYWSQDSPVLIFPSPLAHAEITVRWPGGKVTTGRVASGEREVVLKNPGTHAK
ncbi:MAG TPA: VCBS repeat-containing protein, partial [Candidatus Binatia bacterium]|nr:VCBS repeat-containing protein [Candidatus Binatia bacterium]